MTGIAYAIWFLAGGAVGMLNTVLLVGSVRMMDPALRRGSLSLIIGGYLLRYALVGGVLGRAGRQGIGPALGAGIGLWVARWWGVYLGRSTNVRWAQLQRESD